MSAMQAEYVTAHEASNGFNGTPDSNSFLSQDNIDVTGSDSLLASINE